MTWARGRSLSGITQGNDTIGYTYNADGYVSTGQGLLGQNMFAYCGNDPVNKVDPNGNLAIQNRIYCDGLGYYSAEVKTPSKNNADKKVSTSSSDFANHVKRSHVTTPTVMIDSGFLIGKIGFSITTTYQNTESGIFYSYSDVGNNESKYGVGVNGGGWLGIDIGVSSNMNLYIGVQFNPWHSEEISIGLDGIGWDSNFNVDNTSYTFEMKGGWGLIFALVFGGVPSESQVVGVY